jgi:Mg/Co/Ni transporter MgtE
MLKAELEPVLMDRIITRVFEELNDTQRKEVMKLFDEKKEAEALTKIEKMIPNYDDFLANIFEEFQEEYLRNME